MDDFAAQVSGVGALAEPARRALYLYVVAQPEPVSRDQAAKGAGLPRHTAKFHLDKLVADGLLDTEYRRLSGRRGPGAGRPTKLYRRSGRQVAVTLPPRHYDLAGQILAAPSRTPPATGSRFSRRCSARPSTPGIASVPRSACAMKAPPPLPATLPLSTASPRCSPRTDTNHASRATGWCWRTARSTRWPAQHTALVCGMNLHLITALLDELGRRDVQTGLDPAPQRCCVTLTTEPD